MRRCASESCSEPPITPRWKSAGTLAQARRGRRGDVGPPQGAHLPPTHPRHEEEPCDHRVEAAPLDGDLVGLDAADSTPRTLAGSEDGGQVHRPEGARLAPAALTGGPPIAREDPGRSFPGRARLDGEAGAEARRGHRRRRARRRSPLLVEFGEVAGQGRVLGTLVGGGSGMDSGDSRARGGSTAPPPRGRGSDRPAADGPEARTLVRDGVVEGRVIGWGSGVDSRTTKSRLGHGRRL